MDINNTGRTMLIVVIKIRFLPVRLDVPQPTTSSYLNGSRKLDGDTVYKLALRLGIEIYDALQIERPGPDLFFIRKYWSRISEESRKHVVREMQERLAASGVTVKVPESIRGRGEEEPLADRAHKRMRCHQSSLVISVCNSTLRVTVVTAAKSRRAIV